MELVLISMPFKTSFSEKSLKNDPDEKKKPKICSFDNLMVMFVQLSGIFSWRFSLEKSDYTYGF